MRWCGRGMGTKYVREAVLPARNSGKWGRLDVRTHAVVWAANWPQEMRALPNIAASGKRKGARGSGLSAAQEIQWRKWVAKFSSPSAPICGHILAEDKWCKVADAVRPYAAKPEEACDFLDNTARWAFTLVDEHVKDRTALRMPGWRAWVKEQVSAGGGVCTASSKGNWRSQRWSWK